MLKFKQIKFLNNIITIVIKIMKTIEQRFKKQKIEKE